MNYFSIRTTQIEIHFFPKTSKIFPKYIDAKESPIERREVIEFCCRRNK